MNKLKRKLSFLLIFVLLSSMLNGITITTASADGLITLSVEKDSSLQDKITNTTVTLTWGFVEGARSYLLSYVDYGDGVTPVAKSVYTDSLTNTYEVKDLVSNIIYNFTIEARSNNDGTGTVMASDQMKVITGITFNATSLSDTPIDNNGDREGGMSPGLNINWNIPKMWDGSSFSYVDSSVLDYKVTIGTDTSASNLGLYKIKYNGSAYGVYKDNVEGDVPLTYAPVTVNAGKISYEWRNKVPVTGEINDSSVTPGTIYYMGIVPQFSSSIGKIGYITSSLKNGFAYTPIHIKIGRDSNNNIICTIYRVNYDSKNGASKINFKYEVYSSIDAGFTSPSIEGYEYEQYGDSNVPIEIFIPRKNQTSTFYYKVLVKSDGMSNLESPIVDYNMGIDNGRPLIPQNLVITSMEKVTGAVYGQTVNSVDLNISWDKPEDFARFGTQLRYYFLINSIQKETTTAQGVYTKELLDGTYYDLKYRTIKVVDCISSNIDKTDPNVLKYKISGLNLFTNDDGTPLENPDNYPQQIKMNKKYFIKVCAKRLDSGLISDFSVPVSFTTPTTIKRNPPVPGNFNFRSVTTNSAQLVWQKIKLNIGEYADADSIYTVSYQVYMTDSLSKSFSYIGSSTDPLNITFTSGTGTDSNLLYARISENMKQNTTYYFKVRTKLDIESEEPRYSDFSQIVPVTTSRDSVNLPDDQEKTPKTPDDFKLALDANGNKILDSYSATFDWTKSNDNYAYRIIKTTQPINASDDLSLLKANGIVLGEYIIPQTTQPNEVGKLVYSVNNLISNKLYYFNIRAERDITKDNGTITIYSSWVIQPLTTNVLEAPTNLAILKDGTYNKYSQVKITWVGKEYFTYEVWGRTQVQMQYNQMTNVSISIQKPENLAGTTYNLYSAVISGLESNTKYFFKVRGGTTRIVDGIQVQEISKYIGPVDTRTDFNQNDYDRQQKANSEKFLFTEKTNKIQRELFWYVVNSDTTRQIKLRTQPIIDAMKYDNNDMALIDISLPAKSLTKKSFIIPIDIINYMNSNSKILVIKTGTEQLTIRPMTVGSNNKVVNSIKNEIAASGTNIKDIYIRFTIDTSSSSSISSGQSSQNLVSNVNVLTIEALGMSEIDTNIESLVNNVITTSLNTKLLDLLGKADSLKDTSAKVDALIEGYITGVKSDVSTYLDSQLNTSYGLTKESKSITELNNPVQFKNKLTIMPLDTEKYSVYQYVSDKWNKVSTLIEKLSNNAVFDIKIPVKFAVFKTVTTSSTSTQTNSALDQLDIMYGIKEVIKSNDIISITQPLTFKQTMDISGKLMGLDIQLPDSQDRVKDLLTLDTGTRKLSNEHKLTKEEFIGIALKLYTSKLGISIDSLKANKVYKIKDQNQIGKKYYKSVILALNLGLVSLDQDSMLYPKKTITQEQSIAIIKNVIDLIGE